MTTEIGGYDCKGLFNANHAGKNYYSIDFSWRTKENAFGDPITSNDNIPILAAAGGVVIPVPPNQANGNYIVLSHSSSGSTTAGFSTRYLHLKEILVSPGQRVAQGDVIGYMGNSGRAPDGSSYPSHLHFGVRFNDSGASSKKEISYVLMSEWLLKSFQSECSNGAYSRYYLSH